MDFNRSVSTVPLSVIYYVYPGDSVRGSSDPEGSEETPAGSDRL